VAITVHYTAKKGEKKKVHPYEDEEKQPNRNQQIIISFTYVLKQLQHTTLHNQHHTIFRGPIVERKQLLKNLHTIHVDNAYKVFMNLLAKHNNSVSSLHFL